MSDEPINVAPPQHSVRVEIKGLRKSYAGTQVLKGIDFEVKRGEIFVIMGPSGSGKSTLLNLLGALDEPTSGDVIYEGKSLRKRTDLDLFRASTLGFVFQSFYLLPTLTRRRSGRTSPSSFASP